MHQDERRSSPRIAISRPVKLRREAGSWHYLSGQTQNVSNAGALLRVDSLASLLPGQRVHVAIAEPAERALLSSERLVPARVVRSIWHAGQQHVAVAFTESPAQAQALPMAG